MNQQLATYKNSTAYANSYKEQEILMASPEKCVVYLYDIAIQSCAQENEQRAGKAVAMLTDSLDMTAGGELAVGLFRLYEYCMKLLHDHKFDQAINILQSLRETWRTALAQHVAA